MLDPSFFCVYPYSPPPKKNPHQFPGAGKNQDDKIEKKRLIISALISSTKFRAVLGLGLDCVVKSFSHFARCGL